MKISFITTILNEERSINALIDSIISQTREPFEIVIVDAGSTDNTVKIIKEYQKKIRNLKLIIRKGNRSVGRNEAIKRAVGDVIVATDAGCSLDKNWIKNITKDLKDANVDVVGGYYIPITNSVFERCLAAYTSIMPDKIDIQRFLPSSRSIAFRKSAWSKVGGYPENFRTCEDIIFAKKLKKYFKITFKENAIVYWPQRENIIEAFKQFFNYALGDGTAHHIRAQTPILYLRYFFGLALLILYFGSNNSMYFFFMIMLLILYIIWAISKNYKYVNALKGLFFLPLLQFVADIAVLLGTSLGLIYSVRISRK